MSKGKFFLISLIVFALPLFASAATMQIVATPTTADLHQPVRVDVVLDTQADTVNAIQAQVIFPDGSFRLQEIDDGSSPISFWIEPPHETVSGTVAFSGIIPGGFAGHTDSLVSLILDPILPGNAVIALRNVSVLRNDGLGSPISVTAVPARISISKNLSSLPLASLVDASISPESFTPLVAQNKNLYSGKYFLVFSTTDKGSGIDHYEVAEIPAGTQLATSTVWQVAVSPYLLHDQALSSDIYVRAIDHAGNATVAEIPASRRGVSMWEIMLILLLVLVLVFVLMRFVFRRGSRRW